MFSKITASWTDSQPGRGELTEKESNRSRELEARKGFAPHGEAQSMEE